MASVWKRLQRVNKRAAKFQYTASYSRVDLEACTKWKPTKLSIVWTRRSRRVVTDALDWEPSLKDPHRGSVIYPVTENHTVAVTLFKDSRTNELEDKDWTFVLEDVSAGGKRRRLAVAAVNMRAYASLEPTQHQLDVTLHPVTQKVVSASLHLTLHCVLLKEGQATDEDMQSLASMLSVNNNSDIAVLSELGDDDFTLSDNSAKQISDVRQLMDELTLSLTHSSVAETPCSVQSLAFDAPTPKSDAQSQEDSRNSFDATPTAPAPPADPHGLDPRGPHPQGPDPHGPEPHGPDPHGPDPHGSDPHRPDPPVTEGDRSRPGYLHTLTALAQGTPNNTQAQKPSPQFTSTPTKTYDFETTIKPMVFKPKTFSKLHLKPLELKTNLNSYSLDRNDKESGNDDEVTPVNEMANMFPGRLERDKTPVQDLLEWCQSVVCEYRQCKVTNLTTSWRSGLAFCAIIHHFRPDLIDFSGLQPDDAESNLRTAFEASTRLGVSRVLTAPDVCKPAPDKLAIMTYLFQLRAHFTGSELQVEQLGNSERESSYLVGRHDTDGAMPAELFSREVATRRSRRLPPIKQESLESVGSGELSPDKPTSPSINVRNILFTQSKTILGKVLSPSRDQKAENRNSNTKWFTDPLNGTKINTEPPPPPRPEKLMTRKELTDPFGSDEEEETSPTQNGDTNGDVEHACTPPPLAAATLHSPQPALPPRSPATELPRPTPQLLSRHDELKERARQLLEATKREARERERNRRQNAKDCEERDENRLRNGDASPNKKPLTEEERQAMLRERARDLIAKARAGIVNPTSPTTPRPRGTLEIISKQSVMDEIAAAGGAEQLDAILSRDSSSTPSSRKTSPSPARSEGANSDDSRSVKSAESRSPLRSFSQLVERLTPDKDDDHDETCEGGSYIASELAALEREQQSIDLRAAALESKLRRVMEDSIDSEEESRLMTQWFNLVNKKNALIRRQMQLNILEQEEDLTRRCALLERELRLNLAVDEWRKTPEQKRRERLLLQELLAAVNERDRLVQEMDEQERAIADDDAIVQNLTQVEIQRKNNCILQ